MNESDLLKIGFSFFFSISNLENCTKVTYDFVHYNKVFFKKKIQMILPVSICRRS